MNINQIQHEVEIQNEITAPGIPAEDMELLIQMDIEEIVEAHRVVAESNLEDVAAWHRGIHTGINPF